MKRRPLPGIVAVVTGPKDTATATEDELNAAAVRAAWACVAQAQAFEACETARERVISAAVAYVAAWKACDEHGGYGPPSTERQKHRELVAAVDALKCE